MKKLTPQDVMTLSITLNLSECFSEGYAWPQPEGIKLTTGIICEILWLKICHSLLLCYDL